ncbi:MAG: hypothetical protein JWM20_826 [Patescibacteria group bacterium]|nr:hypothetical protein [Patescibacteria group bacterium]
MIQSRYLIRLDDACHTMDLAKWEQLETVFKEFGIRPIVGVIPNNRDKDFFLRPALSDSQFWNRIKDWRQAGWDIAMHGYEHILIPTGARSLVNLNARTEFAGLPYGVQEEKIRKGWEIFRAQGIEPKIWIAPAHSFDNETLRALANMTSIRIVSDTFAFGTYGCNGFSFIPQQLWKFVFFKRGTWTICLHPNSMNDKDFDRLYDALAKHHELFISVSDLDMRSRPRSLFEKIIERFWFNKGLIHSISRAKRSILCLFRS